jgi:hypothetical protein
MLLWGDCRLRPLVEALEKSWKLGEVESKLEKLKGIKVY